MHGPEGHDQQRQGDDEQPGTLLELGRGDHDGRDSGAQPAEAVEERLAPPPRAALEAPVPDHAGLGDGEADEHTDGDNGTRVLVSPPEKTSSAQETRARAGTPCRCT
nr:hypothetical protein [Actinospica acidiphila]